MPYGNFKKNILARFEGLKNKKFGEVQIPCSFGGKDYGLILLTAECASNPVLMALLSAWRKKHEFWFQAQFSVSIQRTASWFQKRVIETPDRILFIIEVDGKYIGHIGLFRFNFENRTCEIDNIVRGEDNVLPGIIGNSVTSMMQWGMDNLGIKGYTLQTTSDNEKALRLYGRLGFFETKRVPLVYNKTAEGGEWVEAPAGFNDKIERYDIYMQLKNNIVNKQ